MTLKIYGMIDPHTHLRDLAWVHKATFESETRAAIAGGYTAVFDMPNTPPNTTTKGALEAKFNRLNDFALCDYGVYFGASQDDNTAEYADLEGVCGLKIFNNATTGTLLIDNQQDRDKHYAAWQGGIIAVHAEDSTVADILEMVRKYRRPTHFLHISTALEVGLLRDAKQEGLPVTFGVCPHHLYLIEDDVRSLGPLGLMKPTLKTQRDQDALWDALTEGIVDIIESDHAPHTLEEKNNEDGKPVYGVPGLETNLGLTLLAMHEGRITLEQVHELLAENPRKIWGLPRDEGTYTIIDENASYELKNEDLHTACGWSPFAGMTLYGKVREVWIRGTQVYDDGEFLVSPGFGMNLF